MNSSAINSILPLNLSSSRSRSEYVSVGQCNHPYSEFMFRFAVHTINFVIGYPANIMVLWLVARKEIDSTTSDVFFVSLAIVDAFYTILIPIELFIFAYFSEFNLAVVLFIYGIKDPSALFLTCICLDRYVAVVHPLVFTRIKDIKIRVAISMLVWLFVTAYALIRTFIDYYLGMFFTGMILIIFIIMVFCNISIMWNLRKSVLGKEKISPMKKKAQRTVQTTLAIIAFHYLPIAVTSPLEYITAYEATCVMKAFAYLIMDLSCSIEPLLCISKLKQLPSLNNLPCICCRSPSSEPHNVSA